MLAVLAFIFQFPELFPWLIVTFCLFVIERNPTFVSQDFFYLLSETFVWFELCGFVSTLFKWQQWDLWGADILKPTRQVCGYDRGKQYCDRWISCIYDSSVVSLDTELWMSLVLLTSRISVVLLKCYICLDDSVY